MCKEKICLKLKKIYNETNFVASSLTFLIFAGVDFVMTNILILALFIKNNFLIVYSVDKIESLKQLNIQPYTTEQSFEFVNRISSIVQPLVILCYFLTIVAFLCFVIGIYKFITRSPKNV